MAPGHAGGTLCRAAQHGHDHVRPCRTLRALGTPSAARARVANADWRLYRIRAAAVRADGDADLVERPLSSRPDLARGGADARGGASRIAPGDPEHPVLVGQARAG